MLRTILVDLFVVADSAEALHRNLAGLCRLLELDERIETDENRQRDAALKWLRQNPGWLLIFDNVDTEEAAIAVENLLSQLSGGHLLVTSRQINWSGSLVVLPVDTLSVNAATEFLLDRTAARRRQQSDDNVQASVLAETLDGLALALEQASAYILRNRLSIADYLKKWHSQREIVLTWSDSRLMQYPKSVAVTWQTSFDQLIESAQQLLQHVAWISPAPIPESLLEMPIPDGRIETDPFTALAELESYSLVTRTNDSFSVHRLVQDVTRRQYKDPEHIRLTETLRWLDAAFIGDPQDVRDWPVLNPLLPHAQAVVEYADAAGMTTPTARLMNQMGLMYLTKSLYREAEPLMRRALAIDEASFGEDHPNVASVLNNLAQLLKATNRLADAEPLMRRALVILIESVGAEHPYSRTVMNNYIVSLQELGMTKMRLKRILRTCSVRDEAVIAGAGTAFVD
ncbi:tetratricopeptide repeat protein [Nitrosomonas sp. Nm84]|uniref:tetratricopeptide repeat protein n=1 Tax=Nitrosomonas sp. Nm84 TaxID=200124 RepID=UPI001A9E7FCB|nr:tetratricopeptide repeat protein [Nitrosomonas sp. Nm84]